jgi:hypothetical protein
MNVVHSFHRASRMCVWQRPVLAHRVMPAYADIASNHRGSTFHWQRRLDLN